MSPSCQLEERLELLHCVFRASDGMPNRTGITEDLVVVSPLYSNVSPDTVVIHYSSPTLYVLSPKKWISFQPSSLT
jgi:hypothetical protein